MNVGVNVWLRRKQKHMEESTSTQLYGQTLHITNPKPCQSITRELGTALYNRTPIVLQLLLLLLLLLLVVVVVVVKEPQLFMIAFTRNALQK